MIKDFFTAITAYGQAIVLISKLRLWTYVFLPGLISIFLAIAIFVAAYGWSDNIGGWLVRWYPWERGSSAISLIADIFGGLLILALGLIVFKQLVMIVTGPFMSPLSEQVERYSLSAENAVENRTPTTGYQVWRGLRIAFRNLFWELFFTVILLLLGLIPVIAPFTVVGIFLLQSYYFGFGNLDFALERHYGAKDTIQFIKQHKGMALGNGVLSTLALMTVVGFLFILPIGVVAATIEMSKKKMGH